MKKLSITTLILLMTFLLIGCQELSTGDETTMVQGEFHSVYILESKTMSGIDITNQYFEKYIYFDETNQVTIYTLSIDGYEVLEGTYIKDEQTISAQIGLRNFTFELNNDSTNLSYSGIENRQSVEEYYVYDENHFIPETTGGVNYTDELFGEDMSLYNFYNYAPSIMIEDGVMHIWYCANEVSGYVTDYIAYRRGEIQSDGTWVFSERQIVLGPTADNWDSVHTCDPSVIKGEFSYRSESYNYLMAYLGCVTLDNSNNEVGIAVAKNPEGPWIKISELNPIANYYESDEFSNDVWTWGYGQPSLISVDKQGEVLLFYTKGLNSGTSTQVERWDLSNLDNPIKIESTQVSNKGATNDLNQQDVINNADFAYDPVRQRIYTVEDMSNRPLEEPTIISQAFPIEYLNLNVNESFVGETLFDGTIYQWNVHEFVGEGVSGFARNHNPGLITDPYGWLISPNQLPVIYTVSILDSESYGRNAQWAHLHSYRLYGYMTYIYN